MGRLKGEYNLVFKNIDFYNLLVKYYVNPSTNTENDEDLYNINKIKNSVPEIKSKEMKNKDFILYKQFDGNFIPKILSNEIECFMCGYSSITEPLGVCLKFVSEEKMNNADKFNFLEQKNNFIDISKADGFFEVDGLVHSWNCCYSAILQEQKLGNPLYKNALETLHYYYYKMNGKYKEKWVECPNKKIKKKYGGELTEEEFENLLDKEITESTFNIDRPLIYIRKEQLKRKLV